MTERERELFLSLTRKDPVGALEIVREVGAKTPEQRYLLRHAEAELLYMQEPEAAQKPESSSANTVAG